MLQHPSNEPATAENQPAGNTPAITIKRIEALDVIRGIALMGGLVISIWTFGGLSRNMQTNFLSHPSGGNYRLFAAVELLFHGKMLAMICLVFGVSMVSFLSSKNDVSGLPVADVFTRRQILLITAGAINAIFFLATHDVLFHLGIMGLLLFAFVRMNAGGMLAAALFTMVVFSAKNFWRYADDKNAFHKYEAVIAVEKNFKRDSAARAKTVKQMDTSMAKAAAKKDTLTKEQAADKAAWLQIVKATKFDRNADKNDQKQVRSGKYTELWNTQLQTTEWREAKWMYQTGVWQLSCMMFTGMFLFKKRFFNTGYKTGNYLWIAVAAITAGLLLAWFRLYFANASVISYEKYIKAYAVPADVLYPVEIASSAVGYTALITWFIKRGWFKSFLDAFDAAGKMALTNYLVQCLFFMLFFTGYGMTNYGKLEQYQLYILAAEVCLVQVVYSVFWLKYFYYGPAEWLLRMASYGVLLPLRRQPVQTSVPAAV